MLTLGSTSCGGSGVRTPILHQHLKCLLHSPQSLIVAILACPYSRSARFDRLFVDAVESQFNT